MKVVVRSDWRRFAVGIYVDSLTVAVMCGPVVVDFLYRWDEVADLWAGVTEEGT